MPPASPGVALVAARGRRVAGAAVQAPRGLSLGVGAGGAGLALGGADSVGVLSCRARVAVVLPGFVVPRSGRAATGRERCQEAGVAAGSRRAEVLRAPTACAGRQQVRTVHPEGQRTTPGRCSSAGQTHRRVVCVCVCGGWGVGGGGGGRGGGGGYLVIVTRWGAEAQGHAGGRAGGQACKQAFAPGRVGRI